MPSRRISALSRIRGTRPSRRLLAVLAVLLFLSGSAVVLSAATFTAVTPGQVTVGAAEDYTPPTAQLTVPALVAGTVALDVDAQDARTFVTRVVVEKRPAGADTWTTLCTITSAPWTCDWDTTGEPEGEVSLRATATDSVDLTGTSPLVTTQVDNTVPTVSLTLPSQLSGTVDVDPTVADTGSGVASVTIDYRTGTGAWVTLCTRTVAPYSCSLDTTTLTNGASYDFRVTARDVAGNSAAASATATVENTTASVSITSPGAGAFLRGTPTITVAASASPGVISSVAVQRRTGTTGSWVTICTDTTAPYSCTWDVRNLPTGGYELRAVMTYGPDNRTLDSATVAVVVDNTPLSAVDVQGTPGPGTLGLLDAGDSFTFTYSTVVDLATIRPGWTGGATQITATLNPKGGTVVDLAWLDLPGLGQLAFTQAISHPAQSTNNIPVTLTARTVLVGGLPRTEVTATMGSVPDRWLRTDASNGTLYWTPTGSERTPDGRAISPGTTTESGAADGDL
ncbi:MAG: Ig-like domain-containing protein [Nocardioides sp.]|nr:Ig-like domain-containing protein [Nocardioides sp.]